MKRLHSIGLSQLDMSTLQLFFFPFTLPDVEMIYEALLREEKLSLPQC